MEILALNSKFVGHSTEIIGQSTIKGTLSEKKIVTSNESKNIIWFTDEVSFNNSFRKIGEI